MQMHNLDKALSGLSKPAKGGTKKKVKVVDLGKAGSFKITHPGGLHKATHTPMNEKIPESKIKAAEHSRDPHVRHMAASAEGLKAMNKGGSKNDHDGDEY